MRCDVHLVLVAERILGSGAYLGDAVQVRNDILLYIGHDALEAEGLERR